MAGSGGREGGSAKEGNKRSSFLWSTRAQLSELERRAESLRWEQQYHGLNDEQREELQTVEASLRSLKEGWGV